jgi:hypothetical protein
MQSTLDSSSIERCVRFLFAAANPVSPSADVVNLTPMCYGLPPSSASTTFWGQEHDHQKSHRNVPTNFKAREFAVCLWMVVNHGVDRIFWSVTNEVAVCELWSASD